jgi:anti-sigma-K factor RskA
MNSNSHDEQLGPLLRGSYQVTPVRNPDFRSAVWARIESTRRAPATWGAWLRLNTFRFASLAVASIAIAGVGGGLIATAQTNRDREHLVQRYLASIDPHQQINGEHR